MLEFFAYKKYKKNKEEKEKAKGKEDKGKGREEVTPTPVLDDDDESFLRALLARGADDDDEGPKPPLPPRMKTPEITWDSDDFNSQHRLSDETPRSVPPGEAGDAAVATTTAAADADKDDNPDAKKRKLFSLPFRKKNHAATHLETPAQVSPAEESREHRDISRILRTLNLGTTESGQAVSLTPDVGDLARSFTNVLRDLANGVPTAYGDLVGLVEDRDGLLERSFEKMPSSLQKLVMQMPEKITSSLAPEVLAAAAKAQGKEAPDTEGGLTNAAMSLLTARGLQELVTKPGALTAMLKSIMNALKLRFPAFIGTSVLWSVAVFCTSGPSPLSSPLIFHFQRIAC
jgi:hypothetical protein